MNVTYKLKRSKKRKKTISLQIRSEAEVIVSAPYFTPITEISSFVEEKQNWINKNIQKQKEHARKNKVKKYETGEQFLYLGKAYPLNVFFEPFERPGVFFQNDRFTLNAPAGKEFKRHCFISWYREKADTFIRQRVDFFSRRLTLPYKSLRITSAQSRWGSCSEDNHLAFSFRLIMTPPDIIDYVIVHELMHIKEKNHSPKFWQEVGAVFPGYKKNRLWLKDNQHRFTL